MSLTITVGGVDQTSRVQLNTFALTNALGQRDTCVFSMKGDASYAPAIGAAVTVTHSELGAIFGGKIDRISTTLRGNENVTTVGCASWEQICDRRRVGQRQFVDVPAGDVFQTIFDDYLGAENLTATIVVTGPNITVSFDWCSVREAFDTICALASGSADTYMWGITPGKVTRFYKQSSYAAPINVTEDRSDIFRDITVTRTFDNYVNKVFVRLGQYITEEKTNTFSPDGSTSSFTFELPLASAPTITLSGVAKTVGIRDVDTGKDFYWQDGSAEITAETDPPSGTDTLVIVAQCYQSTVVDAGQDDDEVTERSTVEDNSGWYMGLLEVDEKGTHADAVAKGQAHLATFARVPYAVEYRTTYGGIYAGMYQTVTLTKFGPDFSATFIVQSSILVQENGHWFWRITSINGALANGWLQKLRKIATGQGGSSAGGGTVIEAGATDVAPGNVTITSVAVDPAPESVRGRNKSSKRGVTIKYTAPDPVGTFKGVYLEIEAPDQSATADSPSVADTVSAAANITLTGPAAPLTFGPFAHSDTSGVIRVQIPEPAADRLPMGCRARLRSYSDTVTNDATTSPTQTFTVPAWTAEKPNSASAWCSNPSSITIGTPEAILVGGVKRTRLPVTMVPPDDPKFYGVQWVVADAAGETINASGIEAATDFVLEFDTPKTVQVCTVYAPGSDGVNVNPIVDGITPSDTVELGVTGGVVDPTELMTAYLASTVSVLNDLFGVAPLGISEGYLAALAVSTGKIQDAAVALAKLNDLSVSTAKLIDAAVEEAKIATSAVSATKIAALAVQNAKIDTAAVTTAKIAALAVTTALIDNAAITTAKVGNLQITTALIANAAVGTAQIANLAVTTALIVDGNITTAKIQDAAITTAKIGDAQITTAKIQDAAITSAKIDTLAVSQLTGWSGTLINVGSGFTLWDGSTADRLSLIASGVLLQNGAASGTLVLNALRFNGTQVVTTRQTGPGNASGWADATAQSWANNLLTALRTHGLVT